MRTVFFPTQTASPIGGVQSRIDHLARFLPKAGWRVIVGLAWGSSCHDPAAFERYHPGLETVWLDGRTGTRTGRELAIEAALRRIDPDVVVPLCLLDVFDAVRRRKTAGGKCRLVYGLSELSEDMALDASENHGIIDRYYAVSRRAMRLLVELGRAPSERIDYLPDGIPGPQHVATTKAESTRLRIGYVGRLDPDKRPMDLIPLCRRLRELDVPFSLSVVGDGSLRSLLANELDRAGFSGAVQFHGWVPTDLVSNVYADLDVVVLLSEREGLGRVPMEALVNGVLPVVSDFMGRQEEGLLRHEETALVFPVGDMNAAALQLVGAWKNPQHTCKAMAQGKAEVTSRYGLQRMVEGWSRCLEQALLGAPALDSSEPVGGAEGRLGRLLGRGPAEFVRRIVRRRQPVTNTAEWPFSSRRASRAERVNGQTGSPDEKH